MPDALDAFRQLMRSTLIEALPVRLNELAQQLHDARNAMIATPNHYPSLCRVAEVEGRLECFAQVLRGEG